MYKILLAVDGSKQSKKAIQEAVRFSSLLKAPVTALSVAENTPIYTYGTAVGSVHIQQEMMEERLNAARDILDHCRDTFQENGLQVETLSREGQPAQVICQVAEEGKYQLVIMGNRGLGGFQQIFLGSVSNQVVNQSKTSVLVVK